MNEKGVTNGVDAGKSSSLLSGKKIAITGAGPCGLTLARLLQQSGADVRVFELEASATARNQGGSLDLHEDSGQLALRKAGLFDQFQAACRPEGQAIKVVDKAGGIFIDLQPQDEAETRPEIDRAVLREILMNSLAEPTIQWGRPLQGVERTAEGRLRLGFADGQSTEADLVFGCDGTWSRVRPFVSPTKPYYCGITVIETWISEVDAQHPELARLVGPGIFLATGDDKGLIGQRNGDGKIRVYVTLRVPEDWTQHSGIEFGDLEAARRGLATVFEGWEPHNLELIRQSEIFIPRSIYTHPPRQAAWYTRDDATLLGDAAHVMPFFTGRGVNQAMLDAVELADNLLSGTFTSVGEAIRAYERSMFDRMADAIEETLADQDVFISSVAPRGIDDLFRRRIAAGQARQAGQAAAAAQVEAVAG